MTSFFITSKRKETFLRPWEGSAKTHRSLKFNVGVSVGKCSILEQVEEICYAQDPREDAWNIPWEYNRVGMNDRDSLTTLVQDKVEISRHSVGKIHVPGQGVFLLGTTLQMPQPLPIRYVAV